MRLAPEGAAQMIVSTILLGGGVWVAAAWFPPAAVPLVLVWGWSIAFFRDPHRQGAFAPDELCAPADGKVTDITRLDRFEPLDGPALRLGIFLGLFDVHINRSPCSGTVRLVRDHKGRFHAAMKPQAGQLNQSKTLVIDPGGSMPGPVLVRQIVGMAARRIVCHPAAGSTLTFGQRFGLI